MNTLLNNPTNIAVAVGTILPSVVSKLTESLQYLDTTQDTPTVTDNINNSNEAVFCINLVGGLLITGTVGIIAITCCCYDRYKREKENKKSEIALVSSI